MLSKSKVSFSNSFRQEIVTPVGRRPPASEGDASLVLCGWTQWPDTSGHCVPASAPVPHFNPYSTVDITATIYNGQPSILYNGQPSPLLMDSHPHSTMDSHLHSTMDIFTLYIEQSSIRPATHPVSASSETFLPNAFEPYRQVSCWMDIPSPDARPSRLPLIHLPCLVEYSGRGLPLLVLWPNLSSQIKVKSKAHLCLTPVDLAFTIQYHTAKKTNKQT